MIVVIPAYEPDEKLLRLVDELKQQTDYKIIIVDDGSKNPALTQKIVDSVSRLSEKDQKLVLEISERLGKD